MLKDGEPVKAVPIRNGATHTTSGKGSGTSKPRRQSVSHKDPEVVLVGKFFGVFHFCRTFLPSQRQTKRNNSSGFLLCLDHIRPDWNRMLDVSRAAPGSRRNSATQANSARSRGVGGAIGSIMTRPGRSASSAASNEYFVSAAMRRMNLQNMDLEDLMVMEAVRLSLLEEEERRRTQQQQQQPEQQASSDTANTTEQSRQRTENDSETLEGVNEEEDDDDEPLYNSVVNGIRERQESAEGSHASPSLDVGEAPLQELPPSEPVSELDIVELPAFESTSNNGSTDSRDQKSLLVVEGEDHSHLDSVSSL